MALDTTAGAAPSSGHERGGAGDRHPPCGSHPTAWYCVQARPNAQLEARDHLARQGFEAYLPLTARRSGASVLIGPLLGPYLFVAFDIRRDQWRRICHTRGVYRLFGSSPEAPTPVPTADIEQLRQGEPARMEVRHIEAAPPAVGGAIQVVDGPLRGARGICRGSKRGELKALLFLARGPTEVDLPAKWCRAA